MAKASESKKDEKILNETECVTENVTGEEAVADEKTPVALKENDDGKVTVVMPRFLFTSDVDVTHHEICYMGKIYQIQYDEPVRVIAPVADIINNAIEQKKKVRGLIKSLSGKAKEISNE